MYERELEKRTSGVRSSLILIRGAASKVFTYRVDVSRGKVATYSDDLSSQVRRGHASSLAS